MRSEKKSQKKNSRFADSFFPLLPSEVPLALFPSPPPHQGSSQGQAGQGSSSTSPVGTVNLSAQVGAPTNQFFGAETTCKNTTTCFTSPEPPVFSVNLTSMAASLSNSCRQDIPAECSRTSKSPHPAENKHLKTHEDKPTTLIYIELELRQYKRSL